MWLVWGEDREAYIYGSWHHNMMKLSHYLLRHHILRRDRCARHRIGVGWECTKYNQLCSWIDSRRLNTRHRRPRGYFEVNRKVPEQGILKYRVDLLLNNSISTNRRVGMTAWLNPGAVFTAARLDAAIQIAIIALLWAMTCQKRTLRWVVTILTLEASSWGICSQDETGLLTTQ